jgi:uncharacterized protein
MTKVTGSKRTFLEADDEIALDFIRIISDIPQNSEYRQLKNFTHHMYTTRYQHCLNVAWYSYLIARKRNLDYISMARGAMLHDFYLYNRPADAPIEGRHSDVHLQIALANAEKYFEVNDVMHDVIVNHMWPTGCERPKTEEGLIITFTDKYCAAMEWCSHQIMILPKLISSAIS